MNYLNFLILQFIAHLLADFTFQSDESVKEKNENGFKNLTMFSHLIIVLLLSWFFSFQLNFFIASLIITFLHYLVDGLKTVLIKKDKLRKQLFFIDQIFHVIIIIAVVTLFAKYYPFNPVLIFTINTKTVLVAASYLFCTKPTNIIIKEILKAYKISLPSNASDDNPSEIPNVGKLIGNIERILALTLILNNKYEAVGFIIAAKSILRFKDTENSKSEYVLVGSLLSFGIAILIGVLIQLYK